MNTRARLASARKSSDLADRDGALSDVAVLAAAGMVATTDALGMDLLRLRDSMDESVWPKCVAAVAAMGRKINCSMGCRLSERQQFDVAEHALRRWINPVCPACNGRRYTVIPGTPHLSDATCAACSGAGIVPIEYGLSGSCADVAAQLVIWIDGVTHKALSRTRAKLYGENK